MDGESHSWVVDKLLFFTVDSNSLVLLDGLEGGMLVIDTHNWELVTLVLETNRVALVIDIKTEVDISNLEMGKLKLEGSLDVVEWVVVVVIFEAIEGGFVSDGVLDNVLNLRSSSM